MPAKAQNNKAKHMTFELVGPLAALLVLAPLQAQTRCAAVRRLDLALLQLL